MTAWLNVIVGAICMPLGLLMGTGQLQPGSRYSADAVKRSMHLNGKLVRFLRRMDQTAPVVQRWVGWTLAVTALASFVGGLMELVGAAS